MSGLRDKLTTREREILTCLIEGLSNAETAKRLHITPQTVRWYNSQIYSKLGVKNRREAVDKAKSQRLLNAVQEIETPRHNLPSQTTAFIGREQELANLDRSLQDENIRLITILASGGMGKTRLSLEIARQRQMYYPDGTFFVALAPLNSPKHLITSIADTLGLNFHPDREPEQQLLDYLADKKILLILDNFEHLLSAASLVNKILEASAQITMLVTSRERLRLSGEKVFTMTGMSFPDWEKAEDALEYDAVKLFMQNAALASTEFKLLKDDLRYLARICQLTEGMPLAIVLAAAWVDVLSLEEIATEIQQSVDFLATEMRDLPHRQWSIRAVFEPTWKRLNEEEQAVFMKFAVFRGGCTREAAQVVTTATLQHLQSFVNKALLIYTSQGRYETHELLRQYAEEQLVASALLDTTYDKHSNYFCEFMAQREAGLKGREQKTTLKEIDADFENIRTAWNWAVEKRHYHWIHQSVESLCWYSIAMQRYEEAVELFQNFNNAFSSVKYGDSELTLRRVQVRSLFLRRWQAGDYDSQHDTKMKIEQALNLFQQADDQREVIFTRFLLGDILTLNGDFKPALDIFEDCLEEFRALDDDFYTAMTLHFMYLWSIASKKSDSALAYMQESLEIRREIGDEHGISFALYNLAETEARFFGNIDKAQNYLQEMLHRQVSNHDFLGTASYLPFLQGDFEKARTMALAELDGNSIMSVLISQSIALSVYGILTCIDGNCEEAVQLCREGLAIAPRELHRTYAEWSLALSACLQEDYDEATRANRVLLQYTLDANAIGQMTWALPASSMITADREDPETAVHLMSLAFNHPASTSGWLNRWPHIKQFLANLQNELGHKAYEQAWETGKHLNLEQTIFDWLSKYE